MYETIVKDRVEAILKENGKTKVEFANLMGIAKQNVNALLRNPSREVCVKISEVLNVPLWQLFASKEEVIEQESGNTITCPKCGAKFELKE
jgi:transcriptional regulator with XRE-family HTH domain